MARLLHTHQASVYYHALHFQFQRRRRLHKLPGGDNFPTEKIMGAQEFNLPSNSSEMGDFQPQNLYFWKKIFGQEEHFATGQSYWGGAIAPCPSPPATTPLYIQLYTYNRCFTGYVSSRRIEAVDTCKTRQKYVDPVPTYCAAVHLELRNPDANLDLFN